MVLGVNGIKKNLPVHGMKRIVVVGSGIGGMASASLFAKAGHRVNVLEMNPDLVGGHARCVTIGGIRFSMGPQYVWEFGEGETGDRFMEYLGIKESNPFVLMESDGFERLFIGDRREEGNSYFLNFHVPLGLDRFRDRITELFPDERERLESLFEDMAGIYAVFRDFFGKHGDAGARILIAARFFLAGDAPVALRVKLGQALLWSVKEWFDHYGISSLPRRIIYGHGGIFAESESQMSALAFIVGTGNYHRGARYPLKGFDHLFNSMAGVIMENGGTVETGKRVVSLVIRKGHVAVALCEDGSEYPCDYLFSDISPRLTYRLMGRDTGCFDYTPSHSIPAICIGIEKGITGFDMMRGRNYWWQDGNEIDYDDPDVTASPRMLFLGSPAACGSDGRQSPGMDALVVFCPGNYSREREIHERGEDAVKVYREKLASDVISIIDRNIFPGLKSKILFTRVFTSIDIENATGGEWGNAYGRRMNVREILKGVIEEEDCPTNLYNVSATRNSPGIAGGISTAVKLFRELTGERNI